MAEQGSPHDSTLPVFTPEVKRMGGQSRVYFGDPSSSSARRSLFLRVGAAFFAGFVICLAVVAQYASNRSCLPFSAFTALLPTDVGTPEWHQYPPAEPTNGFPSAFPSKYVSLAAAISQGWSRSHVVLAIPVKHKQVQSPA